MSEGMTFSREDAEEYTASLGQVLGGGWRQIAWAKRVGIPKALGLTTEEWVAKRLGGYIKLEILDRKQAVQELAVEGMSQRNIAAILGVSQKTVDRDLGESLDSPRSRNQAHTTMPSESDDSRSHDEDDGQEFPLLPADWQAYPPSRTILSSDELRCP